MTKEDGKIGGQKLKEMDDLNLIFGDPQNDWKLTRQY